MATNWVEILTTLYDSNGSTFDGYLLARLLTQIRTVDGQVLGPDSWKFTVTNGIALGDGPTGKMLLPITEDSNPGDVLIGLALLDSNGRKRRLGDIIVPRPAGADPYPAINLDDILPLGSL